MQTIFYLAFIVNNNNFKNDCYTSSVKIFNKTLLPKTTVEYMKNENWLNKNHKQAIC